MSNDLRRTIQHIQKEDRHPARQQTQKHPHRDHSFPVLRGGRGSDKNKTLYNRTESYRVKSFGMEWIVTDSDKFLANLSKTKSPSTDSGITSPIEVLFEDLESFSSLDSLDFFEGSTDEEKIIESKKRPREEEQEEQEHEDPEEMDKRKNNKLLKLEHDQRARSVEDNRKDYGGGNEDEDDSEGNNDEDEENHLEDELNHEEEIEDDEGEDNNNGDEDDDEDDDAYLNVNNGNDAVDYSEDSEDSSSDSERILLGRRRLEHIKNSLDSAVELLQKSKKILVLTGAGVSVSCGIPDFRSKGGVYDIIEARYNLPKPEAIFDLEYLFTNPRPFFEFAKELLPGRYPPSATHRFLKLLEEKGKLLRLYTQNIDTLDYIVGISPDKIVACHGSMADATCVRCDMKYSCSDIKEAIEDQKLPLCSVCNSDPEKVDNTAFIKPNIVFFGESLPDRFEDCLVSDAKECDLLIVMGSSLAVRPVCLIPEIVDPSVPQILVNRQVVGFPNDFDVVSLGDCDDIVHQYCERLDWTLPTPLSTSSFLSSLESTTPTKIVACSDFTFGESSNGGGCTNNGSDFSDFSETDIYKGPPRNTTPCCKNNGSDFSTPKEPRSICKEPPSSAKLNGHTDYKGLQAFLRITENLDFSAIYKGPPSSAKSNDQKGNSSDLSDSDLKGFRRMSDNSDFSESDIDNGSPSSAKSNDRKDNSSDLSDSYRYNDDNSFIDKGEPSRAKEDSSSELSDSYLHNYENSLINKGGPSEDKEDNGSDFSDSYRYNDDNPFVNEGGPSSAKEDSSSELSDSFLYNNSFNPNREPSRVKKDNGSDFSDSYLYNDDNSDLSLSDSD